MERQEGKLKKVVVIGGGFAGLNFVKKLDPRKFDITIIDRNNYHSFPPLFYQVASAGLDASSICFPLRRELRKLRRGGNGVKFNMGEVISGVHIGFPQQTYSGHQLDMGLLQLLHISPFAHTAIVTA